MGTLLAVLAKYLRQLYKSTSKAKVNGYEFTRLLPPPKGSGFPPTKPKGLNYEYLIEGQKYTLTVDEKQASEFAGVDIKTVGEDINKLENLVRKTGLFNVVFADDTTNEEAMVDFSFDGQTDKMIKVQGEVYADLIWGTQYRVYLTGNAEDGYFIGK